MNPIQITKGFFHLAMSNFRDEGHPIELEAVSRLKICEKCDHRLMLEKELNKKIMDCPLCGCFLPAKARSGEFCPIGKWPEK